jgi:hypothetical protein
MDDPFNKSTGSFNLKDFKMERMILSPDHWRSFQCEIPLVWEPILFTPSNVNQIPRDAKGVYCFIAQPGIANHPYCSYLLYVGKVENQMFRQRYIQYLRERKQGDEARRPHVSRMLQKWDGFLHFCFARIEDENQITSVEDALLGAYLPPHNRIFPAHIRYQLRSAID